MKPSLIFIIGPSCSGKSSMSQAICELCPDYSVLDDVVPLYKFFHADELLYQHKLHEFWKFVQENNIDIYYDINQPCPYSHPNNLGGYLIDNPVVWNIVLTILGKQINSEYSIIEFSRGSDFKYNQFFNIKDEDVYPMSFEFLCENISSSILKKSIILNIDTPLDIRKKRNIFRYQNGGHLVSENAMDSVYRKNIFSKKNNSIIIKNINIPIFNINNQNNGKDYFSFLKKEYINVLNYYKDYHNGL